MIAEKDEMIKELAEKIDNLEKQNKQNEETESTEKVLEESDCDMNTTFVNPGFPCDVCEFVAKTESGLRMHVNAKHTEEQLENIDSENIAKVEV